MKDLYTYPQEVWDEAKCEKISSRYYRDGFGTRESRPGRIASSGSSYPEFGQTIRFNGGTIIDGELYQSVNKPLPKVPEGWGFKKVLTWGTYLVRINACI